jgi:TctA family transporter
MPRQIPLRRARGGGDEVIEGCASTYLKGIIAIIVLIFVVTFCQMAYDAREFLVPLFLVVIGLLFIVFAIQERAQITLWLASLEEQIEQWTHDDKRFVTVVAVFSVLICLILALLGIVILQKWS